MNYFFTIMPALLDGAKMTLLIFSVTAVVSLLLGMLVGLGLISQIKPLQGLLNLYLWLMRGTPLLLQLIFVFYGLPLIGIVLPRLEAALFAFILNYAAYFGEIFRGGFQAVPQGQFEAAKMLQLNYRQTLSHVIAPQVFKIVLPSIGNEIINLIKDSSLVYVIGLGDLLRAGNVATARDVTLVPLILVGIIYLLLTAICTFTLKKIEQRTNRWN